MKIFPWQKQQWHRLMQSIDTGRLHHALLLHGPDGIGLEHFSRCLALALLTRQYTEDGEIAEQGRDAELFLAGSHPDIFILRPEEGSRVIKVDQMRELIDFLHLKSHFGNYKVAIIEPAEVMNASSANGLLKTLEEPPESSLLILNTFAPARLPVTIRSRCQKHGFTTEASDETKNWLQQQIQGAEDSTLLLKLAGTPLAAIDMLETGQLGFREQIIAELLAIKKNHTSPLELAATWKSHDSKQLASWLLKIFSDLVRLSVSASRNTVQNIDLTENLNLLRKGLDLSLLLECLDSIRTLNRRLNGSISYNKEALLEEFLIFWQAQRQNAG